MTDTKKKSRWGIGIAVVYGVFMLCVIGVVIASRFQQVDLVSRDYYDKEIKYQDHIEKVKRSQAAEKQIAIENIAGEKALIVRLPAGLAASAATGKLKLFRPSNASLDRSFDLKFDETAVGFVVGAGRNGMEYSVLLIVAFGAVALASPGGRK